MHSSIKDKGRPDAADGSLLNGMKANISEADVSLNAVHVAQGSASGRPPPGTARFSKPHVGRAFRVLRTGALERNASEHHRR